MEPSKQNFLIGQAWLRRHFDIRCPPSPVESRISRGARRTVESDRQRIEHYPSSYAVEDVVVEHLRFALRYEPLDLCLMAMVMKRVERAELENWVRAQPTSAYARRAWFFYEFFTGEMLDLPDAKAGAYVPALDPDLHFFFRYGAESRYRIRNNLLGSSEWCPLLRRTERLNKWMNSKIWHNLNKLIEETPGELLIRATKYLYTKETRSSFEIEGENPSPDRINRFVMALKNTKNFSFVKNDFIDLHNIIVDSRYAEYDYRSSQNYVGETIGYLNQKIHYISPTPSIVSSMMDGLFSLHDECILPIYIEGSNLATWSNLIHEYWKPFEANINELILMSAAIAFSFVYIHPFEDGNGRIHRYIIHHLLSLATPSDFIFPISAAILRDRRGYDAVLETVSRPLLDLIKYDLTPDGEMTVHGDTADLYRYLDLTPHAEFLFAKVAETIEIDLPEEINFLKLFDRAYQAVISVVDMPDRRAQLFVRLCLQNKGQLSKNKRNLFPELSDDEIARMEAGIQSAQNDPDS